MITQAAGEFAAQSEFAGCSERNRLSFVQNGSFTALAVSENLLLVPVGLLDISLLPPAWQLVRFDPLSGFALVRTDHRALPLRFRNADRIGEHQTLMLMNPSQQRVITTQSLTRQHGFFPAHTQTATISSTLVISPCYAVVGVSMLGGIVESEFLLHFIRGGSSDSDDLGGRDLNNSDFGWGDLGVRLNGFEVVHIDPFFVGEQFAVGDKIMSINGEKFNTARELERYILLLAPRSTARVVAARNGEPHEFEKPVSKRLGGFLAADTFLEHYGFRLDKNLFIVSVEESKKGRLQTGDQLVAINGVLVKTSAEVRAALTGRTGQLKALMQRDSFQFFITMEGGR